VPVVLCADLDLLIYIRIDLTWSLILGVDSGVRFVLIAGLSWFDWLMTCYDCWFLVKNCAPLSK
jgi:hypothetical protein